jgi:hypothetical protein
MIRWGLPPPLHTLLLQFWVKLMYQYFPLHTLEQGTYLCSCDNNGNVWWTAIHACNADHHPTNTFSLHRSSTAICGDIGHVTHLMARFILLLLLPHVKCSICVCEFIHCIWVSNVCHFSGRWCTPVTAIDLCSFCKPSAILVCCFSQHYPLSWSFHNITLYYGQ